ncbi:MAG: hypothetical protein A2481_01180 [Candidatus Yonathbacteria bacterium RIFOXYC2_FULL_47_9]|nr:MAG: hypothetical protein A2481_01180 [Candidatus Yonathbacteria bacterium RIFOXYC2_FULL_47_9]HAT68056.1 hypothetical protein [Candidatus Yonathbacteria bacterium]
MNTNLPKLVVIEGVDSVGKTTLARRLETELGYSYLYTPQVPLSTIRGMIEEMGDINTRFFYYLLSVVAVQPQLRDMLASGKRVVVDRYIYSTMAMHSVLGASVKSVSMRELPILWPDMSFLLTTDTDIRVERMNIRAKQPTHDKKIERFVKEAEDAVEIYRSFSELIPVDTTFLNVDGVFHKVKCLLRRQLC